MSNNIEIFEDTLFTLRQFAESDQPLNCKELEFRLGVSLRHAQRITKLLVNSGWLGFVKSRNGRLYFPTEKTKALFKGDV